ncbi:MAG: hypothetical protein D6731_13130 [Planctomycetota bacterium]|nr:MAG: hypothetical protein D6731_13130 [Planctomycetota bacterium]
MIGRLLRRRPALTDAALQASMAAAIEAARLRHALDDGEARWRPGEPLRLLLVGYLGTRNTGADVRVSEMIRQFRVIFGEDQLELTALTSDPRLSAGYFPGVRQVRLPDLFPPFLFHETARHDGVVACEGSMFKSKFASALTTLMAGALGLAVAQNQVAVGYGAEAGDMDLLLARFVAWACEGAFVLCRNEPSREVLAELGIESAPGTDTAWTFEPAPPERARALLRGLGRDESLPLLVLCPINPFWWPVRPAPLKTLLGRLQGAQAETHYRSLYHHAYSEADRARFARYLDALAEAALAFVRERPAQVLLVGMERLDREATERLAARLEPELGPVPRLVSDEVRMHDLVAVLREARYLVTSRYHAMVCSMPAGVPALGVTMDERIRNLMDDRGEPEGCYEVEAPELGARLLEGLRRLDREGEARAAAARSCLPACLEAMGRMGQAFEEHVLRRHPEFPRVDRPADPWAYLPPLSPGLEAVLATL